MDSSSSQFGGCGHTCTNSGNGYKGKIKRKLYLTRDGRKLGPPIYKYHEPQNLVSGAKSFYGLLLFPLPPSKCLWYQFIFGYPKLM
ncbi:hypothetical protein RYX36_028956 [Vicia faba]